jgi:hypothetical protein
MPHAGAEDAVSCRHASLWEEIVLIECTTVIHQSPALLFCQPHPSTAYSSGRRLADSNFRLRLCGPCRNLPFCPLMVTSMQIVALPNAGRIPSTAPSRPCHCHAHDFQPSRVPYLEWDFCHASRIFPPAPKSPSLIMRQSSTTLICQSRHGLGVPVCTRTWSSSAVIIQACLVWRQSFPIR